MKAIAISDNHLKWEDADDPICKNNEVIIKIKATAVTVSYTHLRAHETV